MKRFICLGLMGVLPFAASASDQMFAYCTVHGEDGKEKYTSKVFTVTTDAMMVGYEVPVMAVNVASYHRDDLKGQFMAMIESEGFDRDNAQCIAAGTMQDLSGHYDRGKQYGPSSKGRFGSWDPEGDFFISSELWPD